jgi:hypothetical protein
VTGLVIQYIEATAKTTSYYYLKDDYGAIIKVNTAEPEPETNEKYNVTGILYVDAVTGAPFISEKFKAKTNPVVTGSTEIVSILPPAPQQTWIEKNWPLAVIIGSAILLVVLIIALFSRRKPARDVSSVPSGIKIQQQQTTDKNEPLIPKENYKTMVVPSGVPKTMKFIPGELEVLSGEDKGKVIKVGGYPTEEGSVVTIGRDQVTGPRDFAHIQLKERTISRRQAELIMKDGKLYIKNLSETNYTKKDGKDLPPNTASELTSGSVLTFGEVEMKYKI